MYIELHNLNGYILDQTDSDFCIQQRVQTSHKLDLHPLSRRDRDSLGTVARTPHFECSPIGHSGISPNRRAKITIPFDN